MTATRIMFALLLGVPGTFPQLPGEYWGTVNGGVIADGLTVEGRVGGVNYAQPSFTQGGYYNLIIPGDNAETPAKDGASEGDRVEIYVDGSPTATSFTWHSGAFENIPITGVVGPTGTVVVDVTPEEAPWSLAGPYGLAIDAEGTTHLLSVPTGVYVIHWLPLEHWHSPDPTSASLTLVRDGVATFTAQYVVYSYSLTADAQNGTIEKAPDLPSYPHGTTVTLTAQPDESYHFLEWLGDVAGSANPVVLTMDGDKAVTATFAPDPPDAPSVAAEPARTQGTTNTIWWTPAAETTECHLEWSTGPSFVSLEGSSGWTSETHWTVSSLVDGQTYYYRVKARTVPGVESVWSNVVVSMQDVMPVVHIDGVGPNPAQPPSVVVAFDGSSSDAAGTMLAHEWRSSIDGLLSTSEDFTKSSNDLTVGDHTIAFTAWDDEGTSSSDVTTLTILNAPPTATIVSMTPNPVAAGATVTVTLAGQDNDEQWRLLVAGELTWPDGVSPLLPGTHELPAPAVEGAYAIHYVVRDDEGTSSPASNATLQVVQPEIAATPSSLTLTCVELRVSTAALTVSNSGMGTLAYAAHATPASILSITPPGGYSTRPSDATTHTVTLDGSALTPGDYAGTITLIDPGASNNPLFVPVFVTVTTGPAIGYAPQALKNWSVAGTDASTQTLDVWNAGLETLIYSFATTPGWLAAFPPGGDSDGPASRTTHRIAYRTAALSAGDYAATITITDPAATNDPATVPVTLLLGSFDVTNPVASTVWRHRDTRTIQWTTGDPTDQVVLTLYKGPTYTGYYWSPHAGATSQSVHVSPGFATGTDYRIRLMWTEKHGIGDYSEYFSVVEPSFRITSPAAGDSWRIVTNQQVTWTLTNGRPADQILFTWYKGGNYTGYYTRRISNTGNYMIYVPAGLPEGSDYQLRLMWDPDHNVDDYSENFSIYHPAFDITGPNSATSWRSASNQTVTWTTTGSNAAENVLLCWYKDGAYTGYYTSLTPNDGDYTMWVPGGLLGGTDYQLRLMWGPDHRRGDYSDTFTLTTPLFTLTDPSTGTTWSQNTWETVTWTGGVPSDTLTLTLYKGTNYTGYYWGPMVNNGSHTLWVSANLSPGSDYRMRIMWTGNGNVTNYSGYFTVEP